MGRATRTLSRCRLRMAEDGPIRAEARRKGSLMSDGTISGARGWKASPAAAAGCQDRTSDKIRAHKPNRRGARAESCARTMDLVSAPG
jgi:hypothetical protein